MFVLFGLTAGIKARYIINDEKRRRFVSEMFPHGVLKQQNNKNGVEHEENFRDDVSFKTLS